MNPFFAYLIKSSICLAVFYCLFRFTMRYERNHTTNRFLLLGILFISAIIPFLNIQFFYEEIPLKQVEVFREFVSVPVFSETSRTEIIQPIIEASVFSINPWLTFYLAIIVALLSRLTFGVIRVLQIIKRAEKRRLQKIVLALVKDLIQPFTFLNKVVLSEKDFNENRDIIVTHEHAHIKQMHVLDLMVCEVITVLHFFNPFMWLLRRDLKLIHEYQADQAVLNKGIDSKKYQLLVLQKSVGERRFAMANHFTQKPILKRLKMMQQKSRKQWAVLKLILFVPILILLLQAFARPELITKTEDFIPIKYTENQTGKWLAKWTADNIGKGFYEPELKDINAPRKQNNVLVILMNARDEYLIEGQRKTKEDIKQIVKNYLLGSNPDGKNGPDYIETKIPGIGKMKVSKGIISYKHDLASSKELINHTIRSIGEACLEVRKEKAQILFDKDYFDLKEERQLAVEMAVPIWFSYDLPKSPAPNYWSPFYDEIEGPVPMTITFKSNGSIIVENHKFNSFKEFEENLSYWKTELEKYNIEKRKEAYYRANVIYENAPNSERKQIEHILYKNGVTIKSLKGSAGVVSTSFVLNPKLSSRDLEDIRQKAKNDIEKSNGEFYVLIKYKDGVTEDEIELVTDVYRKLGITNIKVSEYKEQKKSSPKLIMRLYPSQIQNALANQISINDVSNYTENWLDGVGVNYTATIYAYQNVSQERIQQLSQEMNKGGINCEISVKKMWISDGKQDTIKPPSPSKSSTLKQDCELLIPEGFSPNNDGIHDYFKVSCVYPRYPNAKLMIFNQQGNKLFEKENYGNSDVWGKDDAWWWGTSGNSSAVEKDGKLPAGNYNYVLELGNGKVKKGTVMVAKTPPPNVLAVLPANSQYPIPSIQFHEKWININGERCDISDLKNALEELLPTDGSQRQVELTVYSTVSKDREEEIFTELQNVDDLQIIRKDVTPPPPPPLKPITLKKSGSINFGGKDYSFEEFEHRIIAIETQHRMVSNKNDVERYRLRVKVNIETGTDDSHITRFKEIMKNGKFVDINYSTSQPSSPDISEPELNGNIIPSDDMEPRRAKEKELRKQQAILNAAKMKSVLESREWVLQADRVGQYEFVDHQVNYVGVSGKNVIIQTGLSEESGKWYWRSYL